MKQERKCQSPRLRGRQEEDEDWLVQRVKTVEDFIKDTKKVKDSVGQQTNILYTVKET